MCFAGNVDVSPGGGTTGHETFSLSGLGPDQPDQPPNQYIAALTVTDYRGQLDPVLGAYRFAVEDQPPDQNGGDGDQATTTTPEGNDTTTTTEDGGDAGEAGDGDGGADNGETTTTTPTPGGNQTDGNGTDANPLI